jgi:ABC-type glycerol-3-phosphate transport system substrate-binding protein
MKKLFAILAVTTVFAACGGGENKEAKADTAKTAVDTMAKPAVDTTKKDTAAMAPAAADTAAKAK